MTSLLTDLGVLTSVVVALGLTAIAFLLRVGTGRLAVPAWLVWGPGVVAGVAVSDADWEPYKRLPAGVAAWTVATIALGAALAVLAGLAVRHDRDRARDHSVLLAVAAIGIFGCIPETDVLRLLPGPLALAALTVWFGATKPFGPLDLVPVVAGLSWLSLIDGQPRRAAIVGAAACLAATALVLVARTRGEPGTEDRVSGPRLARLSVLIVAIMACSRVAGTLESVAVATALVVAFLGLAAAALIVLPSDRRADTPDGPVAADGSRQRPPPTIRSSGGRS